MQIPPAPVEAFKYFNGAKDVYADPWPLYREVMRQTLGNPNALTDKIYAVKSDTTDLQVILEANDACDALEGLVRELFAMVPFDSDKCQGAQWPMCLAVWEQLATFMTDLKKKTETSPTISTSAAVRASSQPMSSGSVSS